MAFPISPAQAAILGMNRQASPVATVNAPQAPANPAAMAATGQTQIPQAAGQQFTPNPMDNFLLERANRGGPINTGTGLLGRLAALGVGRKIEKDNRDGMQSAALELVNSLPPEQQAMARFAVLTGDTGQIFQGLRQQASLDTQKRGQDLQAGAAQARIDAGADGGEKDRRSREIIASQSIAARERMAAVTAGIQQERLQIEAMEAAFKASATDTKAANELTDDFRSESKAIQEQTASMRRIMASAEDPSPAGDLALIFNFMKVLDPGSTVREGEFANAQNAGGIDDKLQSLYNQVIEGTRLTTEQRADFVSRAGRLFTQARDAHIDLEDQFLGLAESRGIDPATFQIDYLGDLRSFEPAAQAQPDESDLSALSDDELRALAQ